MARGRKPKYSNEEPVNITEETEPKRRGRRSKKTPTIVETINNDVFKGLQVDNKIKEQLIDDICTLKFEQSLSSSENDSEDDDNQYLFELRTLQTGVFKSIIEALKEILVEANCTCTKNGIRIIAQDDKKGILVFLYLYGKKFEYYKCYKKELNLGINLINFYKPIKNLNNNSTLTLLQEKDDGDHISVIREDSTCGERTTTTIKLLDIDVLNYKLSENKKFDVVICISIQKFQKLCRILSSYGNLIKITVIDKNLIFSCNGDDENTSLKEETELMETDTYMKFLKVSDDIIQGTYCIKDIISFTKCSNISGNGAMKLYMSNDLPLVIEYDTGNLGTMKLCISPKTSL